ncbi:MULTISPECIES: hypothetical protein [unclassified Bradyrhizobium]|uniref:hypothetical protein n=1 Tax=unclassified Bradyrhizobium TaxID=2631580 RepID=UPI002917030A|nr:MULTISPECIES: hypothetical protein [unclassified Bradyrhizobium]
MQRGRTDGLNGIGPDDDQQDCDGDQASWVLVNPKAAADVSASDTMKPNRVNRIASIDSRFRSPEQRKHLIWPRGLHDDIARANDRTCPGKDVAPAIARAFCMALLTKAEWRMMVPVAWDKRWFNLNVAAPKGDLPVRFLLRVLDRAL